MQSQGISRAILGSANSNMKLIARGRGNPLTRFEEPMEWIGAWQYMKYEDGALVPAQYIIRNRGHEYDWSEDMKIRFSSKGTWEHSHNLRRGIYVIHGYRFTIHSYDMRTYQNRTYKLREVMYGQFNGYWTLRGNTLKLVYRGGHRNGAVEILTKTSTFTSYRTPPTIKESSVPNNAKDVDPAILNRDGITITFSKDCDLGHLEINGETINASDIIDTGEYVEYYNLINNHSVTIYKPKVKGWLNNEKYVIKLTLNHTHTAHTENGDAIYVDNDRAYETYKGYPLSTDDVSLVLHTKSA